MYTNKKWFEWFRQIENKKSSNSSHWGVAVFPLSPYVFIYCYFCSFLLCISQRQLLLLFCTIFSFFIIYWYIALRRFFFFCWVMQQLRWSNKDSRLKAKTFSFFNDFFLSMCAKILRVSFVVYDFISFLRLCAIWNFIFLRFPSHNFSILVLLKQRRCKNEKLLWELPN